MSGRQEKASFRFSVRARLGLLVSGVIVVFSIALLLAYSTLLELRSSWRDHQTSVASRQRHLADIHTPLGFGGLIHDFKNYVNRGGQVRGEVYLRRVLTHGAAIIAAISRYGQIPGLSAEERLALNTVRQTVNAYISRTRDVNEMISDGESVGAIDAVVRYDDTPALAALASLRNVQAKMTQARSALVERRVVRGTSAAITGFIVALLIALALGIAVTRSISATERARDAALVAAQQAVIAKEEFLATMSHEIRTPMNGVLGMAELLMDMGLNDQQKEAVDTIHRSGAVLSSLINDILDYSKLEAGRLAVESIPFDIELLVDDIVRSFKAKAANNKTELQCNYAPALTRRYVGDPGRIRQILTNLVGNAIKFSQGREVVVAVDGKEEGGKTRLSVSVRDHGIGISAERLGLIFDPFTQADSSTTREYGGTGLGLSISKRIAEAMGGEISVTSELGKGSEFCFVVSLPQERMQPTADSDRVAVETEPNESLSSWRVLVVEDNSVNQRIACLMLKKLGCQIDTAINGKEAVEKFQMGKYDVVFMDCQMPVMDGFEATQRIRAGESGHVPIVATTANAMPGDAQKCLDAGMDDYISKPVSVDKFKQALAKWGRKDVQT